jgi:hypothetical protein
MRRMKGRCGSRTVKVIILGEIFKKRLVKKYMAAGMDR